VNTKLFIPVALVAAAGLTIAACGGSSGSTSSTPTSPPATSAPATTPTDQFVNDLSNLGNPQINSAPANLIISLGQGACSDLDNDGGQLGPVLDDGASVASQGDLSYQSVGEIIGVAVKDLCPQYQATVQQQLAASGYLD
jgi:hypothetical protein